MKTGLFLNRDVRMVFLAHDGKMTLSYREKKIRRQITVSFPLTVLSQKLHTPENQ